MLLRPARFLLLLALMGLLLPACTARRGGSGGGSGDDDDSVADDDDVSDDDDLFNPDDDDDTAVDDDDTADDDDPAADDDDTAVDDDDSTPIGDDDDDTAVDDDDSTPIGDDDDTADDDDDSAPIGDDDDSTPIGDDDDDVVGGSCLASISNMSESEPNDTEANADQVTVSDRGISISGEVDGCANGYDGWDLFEVTWNCDGDAAVEQTWVGGASDIDFYVYNGSGFTPGTDGGDIEVSGIAVSLTGPETGEFAVSAGTTYWLAVGCWEGAVADYNLEVSF